jgi:sphinganine-1-phosphate aldolase
MSGALCKAIDSLFEGARPSQVVGKTLVALFLAKTAVSLLKPGFIVSRLNALKWSIVRILAAPIVQKKILESSRGVKMPTYAGEPVTKQLPATGKSFDEVLALCNEFQSRLDVSHTERRFSGLVYHGGPELTGFINSVMNCFQWTNPLHFDCHGSVRKMEAEIVAMTVAMFNGVERGACGALTSGGTESIGMAIKAYRDWGRAVRGITSASIVMPITAHPAFDKACWFYGIEIIKVPVGSSGAVDAKELEKFIKYNTVAIVGSAVTYPHGTFDPIAELSELAYSRGIGLHIDSCLGSFIVPMLSKAGFKDIPIADFRLRGVTSISCDTHKYGFAPKGTSVVMYGSKELRSYHFFATADWPGGIYASPGAAGSKPGNVIAGTWAAMVNFGESGYVDACRQIVTSRIVMTEGIKKLPGIVVYGNPLASVFGFGSTLIDIYTLSARLRELGWVLNNLQFPAGIQFSVTFATSHPGMAERFVEDVAAINGDLLRARDEDVAAGRPIAIGAAGGNVYGSQQRVTDRSIIASVMVKVLDTYYAVEQ